MTADQVRDRLRSPYYNDFCNGVVFVKGGLTLGSKTKGALKSSNIGREQSFGHKEFTLGCKFKVYKF